MTNSTVRVTAGVPEPPTPAMKGAFWAKSEYTATSAKWHYWNHDKIPFCRFAKGVKPKGKNLSNRPIGNRVCLMCNGQATNWTKGGLITLQGAVTP